MPGSTRPTVTVHIDFDNGALASATTWTDVSAYVKGRIRYDWGRDKAVDEFQPGRGSFTLDNRTGIFDPSFTSGTYYGKLKPRRRVKITAGSTIIGSGWIEGWPQKPVGRNLVDVEIRFYDFLAVAARLPMPESVYDWQIQQTAPYAWYRMNDKDSVAVDSSGNGRDGRWLVFEGTGQPWGGIPITSAVLQSGSTDPVITSSGRPGRSWSAMQAEVGQPLGGIVGAARTPCLVTHQDTADLIADDFTVEFWVIARQAFPLDITNTPSTTTPMSQPIVTWGVPDSGGAYGGLRYEFTLSTNLEPSVNSFLSSGFGSGFPYDTITDAEVHQIVYAYDKSVPALAVYVDGVLTHNYNITALTSATGFDPSSRVQAVIGFATGLASGLQSTLGDVVFWDRKLTLSEIAKNYRSGRYGNLVSASNLTVNLAFVDAMTLAGADNISSSSTIVNNLEVLSTGMQGKTLGDYLRLLAASEQGMLYWNPGGGTWGSLSLNGRNFMVNLSRASTSQATLSDASGATKGYAELSYRDGSDLLANDVTVRFVSGEQRATNATSIADYGTVKGSVETMLISSEQAYQIAAYRTWKYGQPPYQTIVPDRVVVQPGLTAEYTAITSLQPGTRITLLRTRPDATTVSADYWIDGISHDIEAEAGGEWTTTLTMSPADDPAKPIIFGTSTFGGVDVFWL